MNSKQMSYTILPYPRTRQLMVDGGRLGLQKHTIHGLVEFDISEARSILRRVALSLGAAGSILAQGGMPPADAAGRVAAQATLCAATTTALGS